MSAAATRTPDGCLPQSVRSSWKVDHPSTGGLSMLERLTEVVFIELLRREIQTAEPGRRGWLSALTDPALRRCLSAMHANSIKDWTLASLASESGVSRSVLNERFQTLLSTSPMRYLRNWRLYLASVALTTTEKNVTSIALEAKYSTEAAFNRAFSSVYGSPPAAWRRRMISWRPPV